MLVASPRNQNSSSRTARFQLVAAAALPAAKSLWPNRASDSFRAQMHVPLVVVGSVAGASEHLSNRKVYADAVLPVLVVERVREIEAQRRERRANPQAQACAERQVPEPHIGNRGERVAGIDERGAAEALRDREPELAVQDDEIGTAQREAGDVDGRQRVLRVAADRIGAAGVEENIDDARRRDPRIPLDGAVANTAGRGELAERLIVRLPEQVAEITEIGTERRDAELKAGAVEPPSGRVRAIRRLRRRTAAWRSATHFASNLRRPSRCRGL